MLLAIDTSTSETGLAFYDAGGVLGECVWHSGRDHTAQLLPQITLLLRHLGASQGDIQAVAVALGPGSWSGLRVGMSTAKGLVLARGIPLIGVGTLDALAYQHRRPGMPVCPIIRLGRDRFATARFAEREPWGRIGDYRNAALADLCAEARGRTLFCGDLDDEVRTALRRGMGDEALLPAPAANLRRPGFLAELAWQRFQAGDLDQPTTLEPIYLGQPVKVRD
ncbi:MAG: tRNA (adenosine(37)-N6)-threonylcarbamoyltransferase complex dimerization subunit type 1 TsaB [Roseiflexaceae bacterium]